VRLLIATTNPDKLQEIRGILGHLPVELLSLRDFTPVPEPEETGTTFQENARLKALYYDAAVAQLAPVPAVSAEDSAQTSAKRDHGGGYCGPLYTVAEDSGLVVDALGGEPGVQSARFLRPDAPYPERFAEIQRRLSACRSAPRTARFICAVAVVRARAVVYETTGVVEGQIAPEARGTRGFGYDPIFFYPPYGRTFGETTQEEKVRVAHRGNAFRQLARWLAETGHGATETR
jgi:XTP/dITP diphosphohydrolase